MGGTSIRERIPNLRTLRPLDLHQILAPQSVVPQALVDAQARADALRASAHVQNTDTLATAARVEPSVSPGADLSGQSRVTSASIPAVPASDGGGKTGTGWTGSGGIKPPCANWCDWSCFEARSCTSGDWYDWCLEDVFNGASAQNGDGSDYGFGDLCPVSGTPTFTLSSSAYGGSWSVPPQTDRWASTETACYPFPVGCPDQQITYSVSGTTDARFGGNFEDGGDYF